MGEEREFTREELARHDGVSEPTVYVACRGVVYDVTASPLWKSGTHMRKHAAGRDLTPEFGAAPHSEEVFSRVPRVGRLAEERDASLDHLPDALRNLLEKYPVMRRPVHPVLVHLPMASALLVPFFDLAYLATGEAGPRGDRPLPRPGRPGHRSGGRGQRGLQLVGELPRPAHGRHNHQDRNGRRLRYGGGGPGGLAPVRPGIMDDPEKRLRYLALSMLLPACALVLGYFGGKIAHPH